MTRWRATGSIVTLAAVGCLATATPGAGGEGAPSGRATPSCSGVIVAPTLPSSYYAIDLVPTRRVPGTGAATGSGAVAFAPSPFGVALSATGHYLYRISLSATRLHARQPGVYTAWVSTPDLGDVRRLGPLVERAGAYDVAGDVAWNKFLVIVTLEPEGAETGGAATWKGPVVLRGMSRSGMMHTMAGHGPFQAEPCAKYGY